MDPVTLDAGLRMMLFNRFGVRAVQHAIDLVVLLAEQDVVVRDPELVRRRLLYRDVVPIMPFLFPMWYGFACPEDPGSTPKGPYTTSLCGGWERERFSCRTWIEKISSGGWGM